MSHLQPRTYLGYSLVAFLCCCWPLGLCALFHSARVSTRSCVNLTERLLLLYPLVAELNDSTYCDSYPRVTYVFRCIPRGRLVIVQELSVHLKLLERAVVWGSLLEDY